MVAAGIRTIFVQPDHATVLRELTKVAEALHPRFPQVADELRDMAHDVLALMHFPAAHWRQIYSTNPLERLNREIGRRADVVGIFPDRAASLRLLGAVLMEQQDEWAAAARRQALDHCAACWLETKLANRYWMERPLRYDRQPPRTRRPGPTARGAVPENHLPGESGTAPVHTEVGARDAGVPQGLVIVAETPEAD